jgi:folate-dependent tRNA-U54 methylase TrmFO/GidA
MSEASSKLIKPTRISYGEVKSRERRVKSKEKYRVEVANRFGALEGLDKKKKEINFVAFSLHATD